MKKKKLAFISPPISFGGPRTFQENFENYFQTRFEIGYLNNKNFIPHIILIIGASRKYFLKIIFYKLLYKSIIIQRLDGDRWYYRYEKSFKKKFLYRCHNFGFYIYQYLADHIVYQSNFVKKIWFGSLLSKKNTKIIWNGATKKNIIRNQDFKIICIEGSLEGCPFSYKIINSIKNKDIPIEIYGHIPSSLKVKFTHPSIVFHGYCPRHIIEKTISKNHKLIFLSLEYKAACPNSVIEAVCHNIPVIGHKNSSISELIGDAGLYFDVDKEFNVLNDKVNLSINEIIDNYQKYVELIKIKQEDLTIDKMLLNYEKIFNEIDSSNQSF